ncbi:hypothetical protein D3C77_192280 [compost metagenome]
MPQFIPAHVNTSLQAGQHYSKQFLRPGKYVREGGLCFGFTLAWLKNMQVDRHRMSVPSRLEAMLLQHLYAFGHSTRTRARNDWDLAQERKVEIQGALTHSPGRWLQDPDLLRCCRQQGFQPLYQGELDAQAILVRLDSRRAIYTQTLLLSLRGHALGMALRKGEIALFDANKGVFLFSAEETLDNRLPLQLLNHYLARAAYPRFGVLKLAF